MSRRRITDAHHHFWDLDHGHAYPWLQDRGEGEGILGDLVPIAHTYRPADYLADTASYDVVKSVHIEAVPLDPLKETDWLNGLGHRLPTAIVAQVQLDSPSVEAALATQAGRPRVRGIRHIANWHVDPRYTFTASDLLQSSRWQAGYALLGQYGLSFDLQIYPGQMPGACELARRHPDTPLIINHTGMPVDRDETGMQAWRDGIASLARFDNVAIKISGLGMVEHGWSIGSIRPFVRETIAAFGSRRAMFGSNFPVDRLYSSFDTLYRAFESIVDDFSESEKDQLFRTNAEHWYRI